MSNTVIQIKSSGISGNTPPVLHPGELAINYADGKLYYGNSACTAIELDTVTEPSGLDGEIQFNDSGAFGAAANLKFDSITKTLTTDNVSVQGIIFSTGETQNNRPTKMVTNVDWSDGLDINTLIPGDIWYDDFENKLYVYTNFGEYYDFYDITPPT
jgi:hypothetical protein